MDEWSMMTELAVSAFWDLDQTLIITNTILVEALTYALTANKVFSVNPFFTVKNIDFTIRVVSVWTPFWSRTHLRTHVQ